MKRSATSFFSAAPWADLHGPQALDTSSPALAGGQKFERPAQQTVFQDAIDAIDDATTRAQRLEEQLALIVPSWSMAPVVAAYQAMRGVSFVVAVTFAAEIGDVRRFDNARQVTAFLGLVPSERSTGESVRRGGLTLAGNRRARRALIEAAWTYRYPARVSKVLQTRIEGLPKAVREIAWKAQIRLCARYRKLIARGKKKPVAVAAIAREMAAFLWAIARQVEPTAAESGTVAPAPPATTIARRRVALKDASRRSAVACSHLDHHSPPCVSDGRSGRRDGPFDRT